MGPSEQINVNQISGQTNWTWTQILFWLIFYTIWLYISPSEWPQTVAALWSLGNTLFFIITVNVNLWILLPRLIQTQSIITYTGFIIAMALILTPVKIYFNRQLCLHNDIQCIDWTLDSKLSFISLLVFTAISSLVRIPLDWLKVQKEKKDLITKNIQTELQFLKNQINPHFLFNTLNNLYALTLKKSDYAPEVVLKLSDMMRYMLYECNEKLVQLEKEILYIKNYIELEKIRLSKNADIEIEVIGNIDNTKVAPLLFIPFIENSFKHGLKTSLEKAYIKVSFIVRNDTIEFIVKNSKSQLMPGFTGKKIGGIGLANVKKRLELIYPNQHSLKISEFPDSYEIHLFLFISNKN